MSGWSSQSRKVSKATLQQVTTFRKPGANGVFELVPPKLGSFFLFRESISVARAVNDFITTVFAADTNSTDGKGSAGLGSGAGRVDGLLDFFAFELVRAFELDVDIVIEVVEDTLCVKSLFKFVIVFTSTTPDSMALLTPSISSAKLFFSTLTTALTVDFLLILDSPSH
jgi:hypothetical protein